MRKVLHVLLLLIATVHISFGQERDTMHVDATIPKVFMICDFCDMDYYKNEIAHLVFVRDQRLADFTVLFRVINTGSGGNEYTLEFSGKNGYEGITVQEKFNSTPNMSQNIIREGLLASLNRGSLHYLIHSPLAPNIAYEVKGLNNGQPADSIRDKWNLWIFNINTNLFGSGQEYTSNLSLGANFSANRTSEKNLFETGFWYNKNSSVFKIEGQDPIRYDILEYGIYSQDAISLGKHWAVGYNSGIYAATVSNLRSNLIIAPTVEYNIFPYSEATEKQFRFNYQLGIRQSSYEEPSYRNQMSDLFLSQFFNIRYRLVKNWGNIGMGVGLLHLYDTEHFYNLNFAPSISWNIFKGLNFNVQGSYSIVRDQYFLKLDDATSTEIITGQTQLKSAYNFFVAMGINYSFGSIYNNVVNVRFQGIY
ncbi:MAG: hypothetical protein ACK5EK_07715 [Flavobacteriia bacterium]|jgi:hypothetical protein